MRAICKLPNLIKFSSPINHACHYSGLQSSNVRNACRSATVFDARQAYCVSLGPSSWPQVQRRGLRKKSEPPRTSTPSPKDEPAEDEKLMMQRMLEQRQVNIMKVARERDWFVPADPNLPHPIGWSHLWHDWVAGWELVPIVTRSHVELVLKHYFGMPGKFTPIIFQLDPFAPDFIFRYDGMDASEVRKEGAASSDRGSPGAYYYFRMGDDEVFKFSRKCNEYSPEAFVRAAATTSPDSDIPGYGLDCMMKELSFVSALPDSEGSMRAFAKDCDLELVQFEQRLAELDSEGKERPDSIVALETDEGPLYPLTDEKIEALRKRYEGFKAYGCYSVYSLAMDDAALRAEERRENQLKYLQGIEDFKGRVQELRKELHEITDDEGEFEIVKPQSRGRRKKGDKKRELEEW